MDSRRRSFLAASSAVLGALAGCQGLLGSEDTGGRNTTTTPRSDGDNIQVPERVETAYPQYQYDAANTGTVPDVSGPTGAVKSIFEFGQSGVTPGHRMGSPSLRDGHLYLTEGRIDAAGDKETFVYAIDAVDGSRQWATMYRGTNAAGPTAVTGDVVVAIVGGELVGLDAGTGVGQWSFDRAVGAGVTVDEGTVYVVSSEEKRGTLYALSTEDGTVEWSTPVDAETGPVTPAVSGDTVYTGGNTLQAFDVTTGETRWQADYAVTTPATVAGERVVVGSETTIRAFDSADGSERWHNNVGTYGTLGPTVVTNPPAVTGDTVYVAADRGLTALDLTEGRQRYAVEIGINGTPVVADGFIYLLGRGQLNCQSAEDGRTEWTYGTYQRRRSNGAAPVIADGVAYFPAEQLYAIAG